MYIWKTCPLINLLYFYQSLKNVADDILVLLCFISDKILHGNSL